VSGDADDVFAAADPAMLIVTAASGGERSGCLVGFHSQSSIDPRRYCVWVSRKNHTFGVARAATHLGVHFLGPADHDLAELFGGVTEDDVDKWSLLPADQVGEGPGGVPVVTRCGNRFVGRVTTVLDEPQLDHVGFVLDPVDATASRPDGALRLADVGDIDAGHPA
jgi:flavin reductase (DIM6/NTAB) family NADH-FMN oxidoreductase RutF